jgi:EpsD family peptidyl-prolyl cis-trans isomerase
MHTSRFALAVRTLALGIASLSAGLLMLASSGCGQAKLPDESQIAVHVNDREISVHQVQAVLQRQPKLTEGARETAAAQVLEVLIDQELAAQAAIHQGLESDPAVIQTLQLARRETLARAYHERVAAKPVLPTSDEIDRYYEDHPALFAQRQLYTFQELLVVGDAAQIRALDEALKAIKDADATVDVVRERGLQFEARRFAQAAEDVPLGLLSQIYKAPVGRAVVVPQKGGARVFSVVHAQAAPIDRRTATEAISKFLLAERKRRVVSQTMTALRKDANLRYVGAFAKAGPPPGTQPVPVVQERQ